MSALVSLTLRLEAFLNSRGLRARTRASVPVTCVGGSLLVDLITNKCVPSVRTAGTYENKCNPQQDVKACDYCISLTEYNG